MYKVMVGDTVKGSYATKTEAQVAAKALEFEVFNVEVFGEVKESFRNKFEAEQLVERLGNMAVQSKVVASKAKVQIVEAD